MSQTGHIKLVPSQGKFERILSKESYRQPSLSNEKLKLFSKGKVDIKQQVKIVKLAEVLPLLKTIYCIESELKSSLS